MKPAILIVLLGLIIYANSVRNPFIWDDTLLIEPNDYIKSSAGIKKLFVENMGAAAQEKYSFYRPFQMLTYALDYRFWKLKPEGFHLTSIFLHILASLALFWLVKLLFKDTFLACLSGLFFVVHPVHTEAVTYVSGRSDPLALLFILLTFILYVKQLRRENPLLYLAMLLTYAAALLSREQAMVLPLLLLLYHYTVKREPKVKQFLTLVFIDAAYIVLRLTLLRHLIAHVSFKSSVLDRVPGFFVAILTYLRLLILPLNLHMEYGWKLFSLANPKALLGLAVLIAGIIYCLKQRDKRPVVFFALSWFFVTLLPVSNLYPINAYMAEHWLYLPSVGFFLFLADLARTAYRKKQAAAFSLIGVAAVLTFYAYLTVRQNLLWKDPVTFYVRTLKYAPNSSRAMNNLANIYQDTGRSDEAIPLYKKVIETDPSLKITFFNLANAYKKTGRYEEAIMQYRESIESAPDYAPAYYNLANTYKELQRLEESIPLYRKAILLKPDYVDAYNNLGIVYSARGERQEAIASFKKAIEVNPAHPVSYANLAVEYYYEGDYILAIWNCDRAIELGAKPNPEFLRLLKEKRKK